VFLNGEKISNDLIKKIESIMLKVKEFVSEKVQFEIYNNTKKYYLDFIEKLNLKMTFDDYVIDTANGSAYDISKNLFNGKIYFDKPNGTNINKNCGCTFISTINQINTKKKVSFSFDGDGDRVLMTLNKKVIYGDQITYIIVRDMIEKGNFPNIALSIMTNQGVIKAFKKMNIRIVEVDVGDKNILREITKKNVELGSEPSGHIILNYGNNIYLGDGVLIARIIIDIISRKGIKKVISWLEEISLIPIKTVNFKISKKILEDADVKECLNEIIDKKQENDKIVVRPSGTQNLIRVTVSSETIKNQETIIQNIEKCLTGETL
jgi:phosphoglucosamine mutase